MRSPGILELGKISLDQLFALASDPPRRAHKDGKCIIPVTFLAPRADGLFEGEKDQLSLTPYRKAANVGTVEAFFLDIDGAEQAQFDGFTAHVAKLGLDALVWFTHSHGSKTGIRARAVFTLSEPIVIGSPRRWTTVREELCRHVGLGEMSASVDPACKDASRLYLLSSTSPHITLTPPIRFVGQPIDVQKVLQAELALPVERYIEAPSRLGLLADEDGRQPADLESLTKRLKKFRKPKFQAMIANVLAGTPLAAPGERHQALLILTEALAWLAQPDEKITSLLGVAKGSLDAMEAADPGAGVWNHAEECLWGAVSKRGRWEEEIRERDRVQVEELAALFEMAGAVR